MKKKIGLYLLIAFILANIVYIVMAPLMVMDRIEKDVKAKSHRMVGK